MIQTSLCRGLALGALALGAMSCTGAVSGSEPPDEGEPGEPQKPGPGKTPAPGGGQPEPASACKTSETRPEGRLRRLTRTELDNTFRDLFGDTSAPASALDLEPQVGAFYNSYADLWVDKRFLDKFAPVALGVAERAVGKLSTLHPCDWAADETRCVSSFVTGVGERVFRMPVAAATAGKFTGLYTTLRATYSRDESLTGLLQAMLLSPDFLYRGEMLVGTQTGTGEAATRAQYQVAAQLSYLLWSSTPDEALLQAARTGALRTREQIGVQAKRLLGSPRAREGLLGFFEQLLEVPKYEFMEKDAKEHPDFSAALVEDMKAELRAFVSHVVFEGEGGLDTLLTAPYSFVGPRLAKLYGLSGTPDPTRRSTLPAKERAGLLTQAGLLAHLSPKAGTKPVTRGTYVLRRLLCTDLTPPEDAAETLPAEVATADATTRKKFELHTTRPDCAACHRLLDPIGFGLETYDGLGRFRTHEAGKEVDARGVLYGTGDQDGPFSGAIELSGKLARSKTLHECFATQYFRYAFGRRETEADRCDIQAAVGRMKAARLSVQELVTATVTSDAFLSRARTNQK